MSDSSHHDRHVRVTESFGQIQVGLEGICTADLPDYDVYAIWFDKPFDIDHEDVHWILFDYASKSHFAVVGDMA